MPKKIVVLMMVLLVVSLFYSIKITHSAPASSILFNPASASFNTGQTFSLTARINPNSNRVTAIMLNVAFDATRLELSSVAPSTAFSTILAGPTINNTAGTLSMDIGIPTTNTTGVTTLTDVAMFSFRSKTVSGNASVSFTANTMAAAIGEAGDVIISRTGSTVAVTAPCSNACTLNARQCSGTAGYQVCATASNGCTAWSAVTNCASGQVCASGSCAAPANQDPNGNFDSITNNANIIGWAYDPDTPSASILVHVYRDGPAGQGTMIGSFSANVLRTDVNSSYSITGNHGFNIAVADITDATLKNGQAHQIYVYAINTPTGNNPLLTGSPRSITVRTCTDACTLNARQCSGTAGYQTCTTASNGCTAWSAAANCASGQTCSNGNCVTPVNNPPTGNVDSANTASITGWAYDPEAGANAIRVDVYMDGTAPANLVGNTMANLARTDLGSAGITGANHGFNYALPSTITSGNHTFYIFGIDSPASTNNPQLPGSPRTVNFPVIDNTAPIISGGIPTGTITAATTTTIGVTTNESATCRYYQTPNTSYANMANYPFTSSDGITHRANLTVTAGTAYNIYVRCQDRAGNANTADYTITFNVANQVAQYATISFNPANTNVTIPNNFNLTAQIIPNGNGITAASMYINFSAANLELVSITPNSNFSTILKAASINNTNGTASIDLGCPTSNTSGVTANSAIATLAFKAKAAGTANVAFTADTVASAIGKTGNVLNSRNGATITVKTAACQNICTIGSTLCSGTAGYQTCTTASNGCTAWGAAANCATNQTCSNGNCTTNQSEDPIVKEAKEIFNHNERVQLSDKSKILYAKVLGIAGLALNNQSKYAIAYFIQNGSNFTKKISNIERADLLIGYKQNYGKLPASLDDWIDIARISTGLWPLHFNSNAESQAIGLFKKIYQRSPKMDVFKDKNTVYYIAYDIRPKRKNMREEKNALSAFRKIFRDWPDTNKDWGVARAIAYGGAQK